jgi:hypothetical protein
MITEVYGKGFTIWWTDDDGFFGNVIFYKKDGILKLDTENMSREFVKKVLNNLVDNTEIEE